MKTLIIFLLLVSCLKAHSQTIIIQESSTYSINSFLLKDTSKNKECLIINILSKEFLIADDNYVKPLIVIKVFGELENSFFKRVQLDTIKQKENIGDFFKTAARIVSSHLALRIQTLNQIRGEETTIIGKDIIIKKNGEYYKINGNTICQVYNISEFKQLSLLQANISIINTSSIIDEAVHAKLSYRKDSLSVMPKSLKNSSLIDIQGKIFLEKQNDNGSYHFYRIPFFCTDCPFNSHEEFDYLPEVGIIDFVSKIPQKAIPPLTQLDESEEFYHFIKMENNRN